MTKVEQITVPASKLSKQLLSKMVADWTKKPMKEAK